MDDFKAVLCHHGILGQRWGVRRFQNKDGSVTAAGAKRYQTGNRKLDKTIQKTERKIANDKDGMKAYGKGTQAYKDYESSLNDHKKALNKLKNVDPKNISRHDIKAISKGKQTSEEQKTAKMEKKYTKEMIKYQKDSMKNRQRLNINAYNKTADEYNNGKIAEFNKKHKSTDPKYAEKYAKQFENDYRKNYDKMMLSEIKSNKHYKKAEALVEKYKDLQTTEVVSKNRAFIRDLEKAIDSGKTSWDMDMSKYKKGE